VNSRRIIIGKGSWKTRQKREGIKEDL
jgi:hypothetical protein